MSDFMERARAEAEGLGFHGGYLHGFVHGALWARGVLLADPADAELGAVTRVICEGSRWGLVRDRGDYYPLAHAAIAALLAERRGSE